MEVGFGHLGPNLKSTNVNGRLSVDLSDLQIREESSVENNQTAAAGSLWGEENGEAGSERKLIGSQVQWEKRTLSGRWGKKQERKSQMQGAAEIPLKTHKWSSSSISHYTNHAEGLNCCLNCLWFSLRISRSFLFLFESVLASDSNKSRLVRRIISSQYYW